MTHDEPEAQQMVDPGARVFGSVSPLPSCGHGDDPLSKERISPALFRDPAEDSAFPAQTLPQAIPSHGVNLNALLYQAAGADPHPTVLLLHGLPGNEQNLDCAQAMRRAGWNVLTLHYRGSWGGPGSFSFGHCLEDAVAALNWMLDPTICREFQIDPQRIAIVGHSMGGFVAAHVTAAQPEILGVALISGVDLGEAFGRSRLRDAAGAVDENVGISAGLHILAGTSAAMLAKEAGDHADDWHLAGYAPRLAGRPLLAITSDDGFAHGGDALAQAIEALGGTKLTRRYVRTDHSYSGSRIQLQEVLLDWLERLPSDATAEDDHG